MPALGGAMRLATKLTTQCPQCGGQFDVSMAQLQLRKGFVRCVHCAHIFDGYETVVPEGDAASALGDQTADQIQTPAHPAVIRHRDASHIRHTMTASGADADDAVFSISEIPPAVDNFSSDWHLADDDRMTLPEIPGAIYAERRVPPPVSAALPDFLDDARPRRVMFWCWSLLSVLALLLALAQTVVMYRVQIASAFPATRALLVRLCDVWGCQVAYPRHLEKISILASSLRLQPRTDQSQDSRLMLHVTLSNQADRPQQWPDLLLDLTDFSGAVVIRKHLHPADYLPQHLADQPFAAGSALALRLPLVVQGVTVNGYQIKPFFL